MGAVVMFGFSYVAFNAARRTGRNPLIWIGLVWVLGSIVALPFATLGAILDLLFADRAEMEDGEAPHFLAFWAALTGTVIGSAIAVWGARRPLPESPIVAEVVDATSLTNT
jgi:hypothetical protein